MGLNRERQTPVGTTGPQPPTSMPDRVQQPNLCQIECQITRQLECQTLCQFGCLNTIKWRFHFLKRFRLGLESMEAVAISRFAGEKPFICDLKVFFCNCGGDGRSGDGGGVGEGDRLCRLRVVCGTTILSENQACNHLQTSRCSSWFFCTDGPIKK